MSLSLAALSRCHVTHHVVEVAPRQFQDPEGVAFAEGHEVVFSQHAAVDSEAGEVAPGNDHEVEGLLGDASPGTATRSCGCCGSLR